MIDEAKREWKEEHDEDIKEMMLPLIRLKVSCPSDLAIIQKLTQKVETTDAKEMTNPVRFGQDFNGRVANPRDILQYHRKKKMAERSKFAVHLFVLKEGDKADKYRIQEYPRRAGRDGSFGRRWRFRRR